METNSRLLTPGECDRIIAHLDDCIAMFERKGGMSTGAELRAKALLAVVRHEIARGKEGRTSSVPFEIP
jgi:hypothetical protein